MTRGSFQTYARAHICRQTGSSRNILTTTLLFFISYNGLGVLFAYDSELILKLCVCTCWGSLDRGSIYIIRGYSNIEIAGYNPTRMGIYPIFSVVLCCAVLVGGLGRAYIPHSPSQKPRNMSKAGRKFFKTTRSYCGNYRAYVAAVVVQYLPCEKSR